MQVRLPSCMPTFSYSCLPTREQPLALLPPLSCRSQCCPLPPCHSIALGCSDELAVHHTNSLVFLPLEVYHESRAYRLPGRGSRGHVSARPTMHGCSSIEHCFCTDPQQTSVSCRSCHDLLEEPVVKASSPVDYLASAPPNLFRKRVLACHQVVAAPVEHYMAKRNALEHLTFMQYFKTHKVNHLHNMPNALSAGIGLFNFHVREMTQPFIIRFTDYRPVFFKQ